MENEVYDRITKLFMAGVLCLLYSIENDFSANLLISMAISSAQIILVILLNINLKRRTEGKAFNLVVDIITFLIILYLLLHTIAKSVSI